VIKTDKKERKHSADKTVIVFTMLPILLFLVHFLVVTETKADLGECRRDKILDIEEDRSFSLVSRVDPHLTRCYILFKHQQGSLYCCYGSREECGEVPQCRKCESHNINVDSVTTLTCNLTMESVSEADSGLYKVFNKDGKPITKCHVTVRKTEVNFWMATSFAMLALLVLTFVILWRLMSAKGSLKRSVKSNNKDIENIILVLEMGEEKKLTPD